MLSELDPWTLKFVFFVLSELDSWTLKFVISLISLENILTLTIFLISSGFLAAMAQVTSTYSSSSRLIELAQDLLGVIDLLCLVSISSLVEGEGDRDLDD